MTNISFYAVNELPAELRIGSIYYLKNGEQHIATSITDSLKVSDIIFTSQLPSIGLSDKLYVLRTSNNTSLYIYHNNEFQLLSTGSNVINNYGLIIKQTFNTVSQLLSSDTSNLTINDLFLINNELDESERGQLWKWNGSSFELLSNIKGIKGETGLNGVDGTNGIDGSNGKDGANGNDGLTAYQLAVSQGFNGTLMEYLESLKGTNGIDGNNGLSAYELAITEGFEGTLTEYLSSLKGIDGVNGLNGVNGINGLSAYELAVENGFEGDLNSYLESLKGAPGIDGVKGDKGDPGDIADLTNESIVNALGYTPIKTSDFEELSFKESLSTTVKLEFQSFIPAQQDSRFLQSLCYIPEEEVLLVGYSEGGQNANDVLSDIVKFKISDYSVVETYSNLTLYHINDLTYNQNTNELLIATLSDPEGSNRIRVYDYSSMTLKKIVEIENRTSLASVAYNKELNNYVAYVTGGIAVLDENFNETKLIPVVRYSDSVLQSIESVGNLIYINFNNLIQVIDFNGNKVREWYLLANSESEGITHLGNGDFLIGQISIHSYRYNPRTFKFNIFEEKNNSNWTTIDNISNIGLIEGSETETAIAVSMANKSIFNFEKKATNTSTIYPASVGFLKVTKSTVSDVIFEFWDTSNTYWTAYFNSSATTPFSGWRTSSMKHKVNNSDLNTIKSEGNYYVFAANANSPESTSGYLTVKYYNDNTVRQMFEPSYGSGQHFYTRNLSNNTWGLWNSFYGELNGSGSPEGVVSGRVGNLYTDTSGGFLYFKKSGTSTTGWQKLSNG